MPKKPRFFPRRPADTRQARGAKPPKSRTENVRPAALRTSAHGPCWPAGCARGRASRPKSPKSPPSGASLRHAATEKRKQQNNDHDETPRAARPPVRPVRRSISRIGSLVIWAALKSAIAIRSWGIGVRGKRRGEARERSFMRTCGAEKLP